MAGAATGPSGTGRSRGHRRLGTALALVSVAAVTAAVVWWLGATGQVGQVPEVAGTPHNDASRVETTGPTTTPRPPAAIAPPEATRTVAEPGTVAVPDVRRLGTDEARMALSDAGFEVEIRKNRPYVGGNIVVRQSPAAGRFVKPGSKVVIVIA
ncbi:PASTA domain-containing protein [Actinopolymorpha cephalotaxi]|nr:PASTA domain-containing protein [Actinopolymorpha cephalotaxi]